MSFVGMLYTFPSTALTANGVSVHLRFDMSVSWVNYIHISAWGFGVARFDLQGHSQEPLTVKRATVQGFTLFLCLKVCTSNYKTTVV